MVTIGTRHQAHAKRRNLEGSGRGSVSLFFTGVAHTNVCPCTRSAHGADRTRNVN